MQLFARAFSIVALVATLALAGCASLSGTPDRESGMASVNGTRLYYETAGTGEPVIFVHGFTLDTRMWDDQFAEFAKRYRAIRYDARGFGKSAGITGPFSIRDDLRALMDHLGVKQAPFVVLIGASMPSILAEISFVTNPQDAKLLKNSNYRQRIAQALFDGVRKYQTSLKNAPAVAHQD